MIWTIFVNLFAIYFSTQASTMTTTEYGNYISNVVKSVDLAKLNSSSPHLETSRVPKFSHTSKAQLATVDPELQILFKEVVKHFDCQVLEGFRNEADQEKAFKAGNSKLRWPNGNHNHFPSSAIDVSPYPVDWKNTARFYWFAGYVMGVASQLKAHGKMKHNIRFGGDWNRNYDITDEKGLRDLVHFEIET